MKQLSSFGFAALLCAFVLPPAPAGAQTALLKVTAGSFHSMALNPDGTIVGWGRNIEGQCDVPVPNGNFVALAGGGYHSLGLKSDGSIAAWGLNAYGQCDPQLPNADFVAVCAGFWHSLGLKSDGTIVTWGDDYFGQCDVPAPNANFAVIASGPWHSLGLRSDGTIVGWGLNDYGQCNVPMPNANFVAVAGGGQHTLGLKSDGTIVAWGRNSEGQCYVPEPNSGFVSIAAGSEHSLGLKGDGTIVTWGSNLDRQCSVPLPNFNFVAIAASSGHSLGLKSDGTIVAWGNNDYGQSGPPAVGGCPGNTVSVSSDGCSASYDATTGILDASVDTECSGTASIAVADDFVIQNLPTGMPLAITCDMNWVIADGGLGGCFPSGITTVSPILPAQVRAGEPFRLQFSATVQGYVCSCDFGPIPVQGSAHGHLTFSGLPAGAIVTSCRGFLQGDVTAVAETRVESPPLAIHRLSPNPSSGSFMATIALPGDSPSSLDVFDVRGRLVTSVPLRALGRGEHKLDVKTRKDLSSGIYFVRLTQGQRTVWAKEAIVH